MRERKREREGREEGRVGNEVFCLQLTEVASVAMAEGHPHISDFFLECNTNTLVHWYNNRTLVYWHTGILVHWCSDLFKILHFQSFQQLNTNFLYGHPSPMRFSLEKKLLTLEDFVHHTDLFFPGRADEFFTDLVHTFHEVYVHV